MLLTTINDLVLGWLVFFFAFWQKKTKIYLITSKNTDVK